MRSALDALLAFFFLVTQQVKFACDMTRSNDDKQCGVKVLKMASSDQVYLFGFHVTAHGRLTRENQGKVSSIKHAGPKFSIAPSR